MKVDARAEPVAIRLGQPLEYQILLKGPAARGSTMHPDLQALARLPLAAEVEPLGTRLVPDPPSRIFRYRLRPIRPGSLTIPPVAISYFDPSVGRYFTTATPSVSVRVVDVPRFNPDRLAYGSPAPAGSETRVSRGNPALWILGVPIAAILAFTLIALWRRRPGPTPQAFARRTIRRLHNHSNPEQTAILIATALTRYLGLAIGRPEGALTPSEARHEVAELSGEPALGLEAGRLINRCDRVRFGGQNDSAASLAGAAIQLFEALAELAVIAPEPGPEKEQGRQSRPLSASDPVPPQTIIPISSEEP